MSLTMCFECGMAFSGVDLSCPRCQPRNEEEVARVQTAVRDSSPARRVAAAMSVCVPGTGHVHRGWINEGIAWLVIAAVGYTTALPLGVLVHTLCVWHAATAD